MTALTYAPEVFSVASLDAAKRIILTQEIRRGNDRDTVAGGDPVSDRPDPGRDDVRGRRCGHRLRLRCRSGIENAHRANRVLGRGGRYQCSHARARSRLRRIAPLRGVLAGNAGKNGGAGRAGNGRRLDLGATALLRPSGRHRLAFMPCFLAVRHLCSSTIAAAPCRPERRPGPTTAKTFIHS